MKQVRILLSAVALGALCASSALAQSAPSSQDRHHQWMEAHKGDHQGDWAQFHARMCNDGYARGVGAVAYLGAKLDLSESQRPLFERWKGVVLDAAQSRKAECLAHAPDMAHRPSLLEREAHMRERLKDRLAAMDAQQPALEALYNSLSPEQKQELDHMHGMGGHGGMHGGMHGRMGGWHHDGNGDGGSNDHQDGDHQG